MKEMDSNLKNYYGTFYKVTKDGDTLVLRFHDGYIFNPSSETSIVLIRVEKCKHSDIVLKRLSESAGEEVDGLLIERLEGQSKFSIDFCWANDGKPFELYAKDIIVSYEQYTIEDHREYIQILEDSWKRIEWHTIVSCLRLEVFGLS